VFPVSVKFLGLNRDELSALLAKLQADNKIIPTELMEEYESAVREARAVAAMIEDARLRVALVLNMPVYEDDEEDDGDDAA
jgi:hypothetical protein